MADLLTGADAVVDEVFSYQKVNKLKNHFYAAAAPAAATAGVLWIDSDDDVLYRYDGAAWVGIVLANGLPVMTGTFQEDKGANVVSASPLLILGDGNLFVVTGNNGINEIQASQSQPGTEITLVTTGTPLFTHHAVNLILPGAANITAAAGDVIKVIHDAAGNKWRCTVWTKADGTAVVGGAVSPRTSVTKTANYAILAGDGGKTIEMDNAAARTFTFPALGTLGKGWWVKLVKEGAGDVSLIPNGAEEIGRFGNNTVKNEQAAEAGWANITVEVAYDETKLLIIGGDGTWNT